jgi:Rrf2 family protein
MKISSQEEYGLRCMLRLAEAGEGQSLTLPEIASAEALSVPYVAKLLSGLRQAGFIDSARGRSGGYRLARPAKEIGLGSLLLVLGEPLFDEPGYCERHAGSATAGGPCVHNGACSLRGLWHTLEQWLRGALDQITLADLCQGEGRITELVRSRLGNTASVPHRELVTLTTLTVRRPPMEESAAGCVTELSSGLSDRE